MSHPEVTPDRARPHSPAACGTGAASLTAPPRAVGRAIGVHAARRAARISTIALTRSGPINRHQADPVTRLETAAHRKPRCDGRGAGENPWISTETCQSAA